MYFRNSANEISDHIDQLRSLERKSAAYYAYQAIHRFTVPDSFFANVFVLFHSDFPLS